MMNVELLVNTIKSMVDSETTVTSNVVQKSNVTLTGISIGKDSVIPTVYVENYEDLYESDGYEAVAREMINLCESVRIPNFSTESIMTLDYAKKNLQLCVEPKGINKNYVTIPYLDLELYFRVKVSNEGTYRVKREMLSAWGITKVDLLDIVEETNEYIVSSMKEMMIQLMIDDGTPEYVINSIREDNNPDQTVVTNKYKLFGASAIYNKEILKEVADKYKSDLYILPSSIHEILLIPISIGDKKEIDSMVREVNETQVDPQEVLSNHAYIFRRDTMEIYW